MTPYKATIKRVTPLLKFKHLADMIPACYLGISIGNIQFTGERLEAILRWVSEHSKNCLIVIGDTLSRHTVMAERNCSEDEAAEIATHYGDESQQQIKVALSKYPPAAFEVRRWSSFTSDPRYLPLRAQVADGIKKHVQLSQSIDESAESFVRRLFRNRKDIPVSREVAVMLSRRYIEEEIAVFALLVSDGWSVEVYPGPELPVLRVIARHIFDGLPTELSQRINIELSVRPQLIPET